MSLSVHREWDLMQISWPAVRVDSAFAFRWIDNRRCCQRPSIHVCYRCHRGEDLSRYLNSPSFLCDIPSSHLESKDEGYGGARTPTFGRVMSGLHRRDTNLSGGNPSSKIWGLYLSQAAKVDKEHSDIWIGNTDSVLVFVRHELLYSTRL
jgi:hypothetical protein